MIRITVKFCDRIGITRRRFHHATDEFGIVPFCSQRFAKSRRKSDADGVEDADRKIRVDKNPLPFVDPTGTVTRTKIRRQEPLIQQFARIRRRAN